MNRLFRLALLMLLTVATAGHAAPSVPVEGTDFERIDGGVPYEPVAGKVEVVAVFGYLCPHCARFDPALSAWAARLPAQVRFVAIPADFRSDWVPFARAYHAAQALGVAARSHAAMYEALHETQALPMQDATPEEIATFYQRYGVAPGRFLAAYRAPAVDARMARARDFVIRSGIDGTPALIVAGRYRVTASSRERQLDTARWLVDREIAGRKRR